MLIFLLAACASGVPTDKIDFTYAFCDGNSKLWKLEKVRKGEVVIEDFTSNDSDCFIFYLSGKVIQGNLKDFSNRNFKSGTYSIDNENGYLTIDFPNEKWDFVFQFSFEDKLRLIPTTNSDIEFTLDLIPFPEL